MTKHPQYRIKQAKDGQFYFNLTARNGCVMASSEMYMSKSACMSGIESVKGNAPIAEINDTTKEKKK